MFVKYLLSQNCRLSNFCSIFGILCEISYVFENGFTLFWSCDDFERFLRGIMSGVTFCRRFCRIVLNSQQVFWKKNLKIFPKNGWCSDFLVKFLCYNTLSLNILLLMIASYQWSFISFLMENYDRFCVNYYRISQNPLEFYIKESVTCTETENSMW